MADMIARLKVDSSEYDAKIKRAAQGIQHLAETCHNAGGILNVLEDENREYIQNLGNMATVATTARGKVAELTSAFIDIKSVYNSLTDEEKNGEFGRELNKQLDIMKDRIADGKKELEEISKELRETSSTGQGTSGILDKLADKFTINIDAIKLFDLGLKGAKAALDVAKDAFQNTESGIDEWGRAVAGAESVYSTFLNTINGGNWSDFFANLSDAVQGARDLYDAFDRLNSIKANNAVAIAMAQAEIQQLRILKQQGQDVDDKIKAATQRLASLQNQGVQAGINAGKQSVTTTLRNAINTTEGGRGLVNDKTIEYVAERIAKGGQDAFDNAKKTYERLSAKASDTRSVSRDYSGRGLTTVTEERFTNLDKLTNEEKKQFLIAKAITEKETEIQQGTAQWAQAIQEQASVNREQFKGNRYALQGSGGGSSSTKPKTYDEGIKLGKGLDGLSGVTIATYESMDELNRQLSEYKKALNAATNVVDEMAARKGIADVEWKMSDVGRQAAKLGWSKEDLEAESKKMQEALGNIEPLKIEAHIETDASGFAKDAEDMAKEWNAAGTAIKAVGAAMASIEDPAAKVMGTIAQAVATIALGFAEAQLQAAKNPANAGWGWIAFAATGLATMVSTISAIKSATAGSYANGGIIPGNSFSGDLLTANVNSGELILSRAQQDNLAADLQRRDDQHGATMQPYVLGEQIYLGLKNYLMSAGIGELVISKR